MVYKVGYLLTYVMVGNWFSWCQAGGNAHYSAWPQFTGSQTD